MDKQALGKQGENLAAAYLLNRGYQILERNWRFRHIEVDLIARHENLLVIAEVKTRSDIFHGEPYLAVDYRKQRALVFAAERYLMGHNLDLEVRFDIFSVLIGRNHTRVEHIPEAFHPLAR
jgi:putative endonuclease